MPLSEAIQEQMRRRLDAKALDDRKEKRRELWADRFPAAESKNKKKTKNKAKSNKDAA